MKKLYHKATVHPTPPVITDQLSFLPATILTLAAALSTEDREVLAYLIYCSSAATPPAFTGNPKRNTVKNADHATLFNCSCFRCYTSYWVRWDESPNRELIHEIIDAFEEWLAQSNSKGGKKGKGKKEKRNKKGFVNKRSGPGFSGELNRSVVNESAEMESVAESSNSISSSGGGGGGGESGERVVVVVGGGGGGDGDEEKGSVRKFVSFIGERIWGVWG